MIFFPKVATAVLLKRWPFSKLPKMLPNIWKKFVGKRSIKMADQSGHTACHIPLPSKLDQKQLSCEILIVGGFEI